MSRLGQALRKEVVENHRQIALTLIGLYAVYSLIMIFGNWVTRGSDDVQIRHLMVMMVASTSWIVVASLSFRGLVNKPGRIELFMSPSSMTEKFIVNLLVYVVGFMAASLVIIQLADLTRIAVLWFARSNDFIVPGPICFVNFIGNALSPISSKGMNSELGYGGLFLASAYIGIIVASPGLYYLGSALWPRLSFLKTFAVVYAIETVIFIVGMIAMSALDSPGSLAPIVEELLNGGNFSIAVFICSVVQAVLFWWLSWVVFRRKDVVSRGVFH